MRMIAVYVGIWQSWFELVCDLLSCEYFGDLVTEIHYFSPLNDILAHNSEQGPIQSTSLTPPNDFHSQNFGC